MPREMLYEESASNSRANSESKLYMLFLVCAIVFFAAGGITAFFATSALQSLFTNPNATTANKIYGLVQWLLFIAILLGGGVLFWFIKKRFNVSYDYSFVEDELRVTKVFNGRSRKYLTTINASNILKIGRCDKPSYTDALRGLGGGKAVFLTPNKVPAEEKEFFYLLASGSLGKTLYVIECRKEMLEYLVKAAGITKFERE